MRLPTLWSLAVLAVAGCSRGEGGAAADSSTTAGAPEPAAFAGHWTVSAFREGSDISYVTYDIHATGDTSGWTAVFPGHDALAARVLAMGGDSVVVEIGPYRSVVRPGIDVMAHTVSHLANGRITGRFTARYRTREPDSLVTGRLEGTRVP